MGEKRLHERRASVFQSTPAADRKRLDQRTRAKPLNTCAKPRCYPTTPTAPPSRKNTHSRLRTRDRERKLLKKVQQSIASIDTDEYGWCVETGEPIGVQRLLARPTATAALGWQRRELKQKLYGE